MAIANDINMISRNLSKIHTKENSMKNVLFLAPSYKYAKAVIDNQEKDLARKQIHYIASKVPGNCYIRTDKVHIEIYYNDPITWILPLFLDRDAIFGKKELVDKVYNTYRHSIIRRPDMSLSKYIREAHVDDTLEDFETRTTYLPEITKVHFNDPVTVVLWDDGTKTMVRCQDGDTYSAEMGLALCIAKKALGNMPNFNNVFRKWIPEEEMSRSINIVLNANNKDSILGALETNLQEFIKDWNEKAKRHRGYENQLP